MLAEKTGLSEQRAHELMPLLAGPEGIARPDAFRRRRAASWGFACGWRAFTRGGGMPGG